MKSVFATIAFLSVIPTGSIAQALNSTISSNSLPNADYKPFHLEFDQDSIASLQKSLNVTNSVLNGPLPLRTIPTEDDKSVKFIIDLFNKTASTSPSIFKLSSDGALLTEQEEGVLLSDVSNITSFEETLKGFNITQDGILSFNGSNFWTIVSNLPDFTIAPVTDGTIIDTQMFSLKAVLDEEKLEKREEKISFEDIVNWNNTLLTDRNKTSNGINNDKFQYRREDNVTNEHVLFGHVKKDSNVVQICDGQVQAGNSSNVMPNASSVSIMVSDSAAMQKGVSLFTVFSLLMFAFI
ncbi:uncharacterized protein NDAI_0B04420 [Naumovozyma dairenensis CBS 421]|uniref:FAS1 domain-containing protein n=1 Tax=Naumovozyma dairenensis (strain ATCC 10597 / BCRC 20456 / CBS 421 / NBRC 0211 / NRRL Y-12639) TaxID=1071378 RepID=G0W6R5_NAUDC|nr:hypothetical protein NDAI_0B04420 [Naumovozyma dairenensis CBS 421]CCD23476.1 hypothetical protein NDAI_0B04420 [Naumovozyma dairenensis CBS 421]